MDQVPTEDHEARPGAQFVDGLDSLPGELDLLCPFVPSTVAVSDPPCLHEAQLGVSRLDETEGAAPLFLSICAQKKGWGGWVRGGTKQRGKSFSVVSLAYLNFPLLLSTHA